MTNLDSAVQRPTIVVSNLDQQTVEHINKVVVALEQKRIKIFNFVSVTGQPIGYWRLAQ